MITGFAKISEEDAEKLLQVPVKFTDVPTIVASVDDILARQNEIKNPTPDKRPLMCIYSMLNRLDIDTDVEIIAQGIANMDVREVNYPVVCTMYMISTELNPAVNRPYVLLTMIAAPHIFKLSLLPMRTTDEINLVHELVRKVKSSCLVDFNFIESTEEAANAEILANMPSPSGVN